METLARKNLDMTAVSEMPLFRGISVFELTRMADIMDIRLLRYERGEMIQERGGAVRKVRVITNGLVCADLLDAEDPAEWERNCLGARAVLGRYAVFSAERISPVGFMAASRTCELVCFDPLLLPDKDVPAHIRMRFAENCLNL
ncbi:MAG: hypothetical protein IIZ45_05130, partial [Firmicutes bacterium]|nr:hypothetical protein [Bacillota bacterium]